METCIYKGIVTHRRFKPKKAFFSYKTFSVFFDLDELKDLEKKFQYFLLINLIYLVFIIKIMVTEMVVILETGLQKI